jgi:hypothetical protein
MFMVMLATAFDTDAPLDQRRAIIRRDGDGVEMIELEATPEAQGEPAGHPDQSRG